MKKSFIAKFNKPIFIVLVASILYATVFSFLSIRRVHILWASYFDMGIMHQTVYNTFEGLKQYDFSRILELTDPHGSGNQIKRMAVHNDIILAFISPLYFIYAGPETLLVSQSIMLASGAIALFFIIKKRTAHWKKDYQLLSNILLWLIPCVYLIYAPLHKSNLYEFHAITLATALILWTYFFYITKKWWLFCLFIILTLLTKEQIGFSLAIFLLVESQTFIRPLFSRRHILSSITNILKNRSVLLLFIGSFLCLLYVAFTVYYFMPSFRGGNDHFALNYFAKDTSNSISFISSHILQLINVETIKYLLLIVGPLVLLPLGSIYFLPAIPELLINLLSSSPQMKSMYFHYTAAITPWLFIATIDTLVKFIPRIKFVVSKLILGTLVCCAIVFSILESPLPYSITNQNGLWTDNIPDRRDILVWQQILDRDDIRVSSTGQYAPYLTSRRYFYDFGPNYTKADYVLLRKKEVFGYPDSGKLIPIYKQLTVDPNYIIIYTNNDTEVYKKIESEESEIDI